MKIKIIKDLSVTNKQLKYGNGYDHNFVINKSKLDSLCLAATVYSPSSGIEMQVFTTEPGIQFYGGNFFSSAITGKDAKKVQFRCGFALETQHSPDSPNQLKFPSAVINLNKNTSLKRYIYLE